MDERRKLVVVAHNALSHEIERLQMELDKCDVDPELTIVSANHFDVIVEMHKPELSLRESIWLRSFNKRKAFIDPLPDV